MKTTYRQEYVRCGKRGCKKCPHGPYWYAYWHDDKGKLRKKYIGKKNPFGADQDGPEVPVDRLDEIFSTRFATLSLAKEILGLDDLSDYGACKKRFRQLVLENHPDRGGHEVKCKRITAAWAYVTSYMVWEWGNVK